MLAKEATLTKSAFRRVQMLTRGGVGFVWAKLIHVFRTFSWCFVMIDSLTATIDLTEPLRNEAQRRFSALFLEHAAEELLKQLQAEQLQTEQFHAEQFHAEQLQSASQPPSETIHSPTPVQFNFRNIAFRRSQAALC